MNEEYKGHGNVYLTAKDVQECKDNGWITDTMLSNVDEIVSEETRFFSNAKATVNVLNIEPNSYTPLVILLIKFLS